MKVCIVPVQRAMCVELVLHLMLCHLHSSLKESALFGEAFINKLLLRMYHACMYPASNKIALSSQESERE
jgi:hypothetical protein